MEDFATLKLHTEEIFTKYMDTEFVAELHEKHMPEQRRHVEAGKKDKGKEKLTSEPHVKAGDMIFENAVLFMRNVLLTHKFMDAVKCGDSRHIIIVLKQWALAYCGHG